LLVQLGEYHYCLNNYFIKNKKIPRKCVYEAGTVELYLLYTHQSEPKKFKGLDLRAIIKTQ